MTTDPKKAAAPGRRSTDRTPRDPGRAEPSTDAARDALAPARWRIWQLTKANLIGLALVTVSYVIVGWLVLHVDQIHRDERRADLCAGIREVMEGPMVDALAAGFHVAADDPDVDAFRAAVRGQLGPDCTGPKP